MPKQLSWIDQRHSVEDFIKWNPQLWFMNQNITHMNTNPAAKCSGRQTSHHVTEYELNSCNTEATKFGHGTMLNYGYFSLIPKWYRPNQIRIWSHSYFIVIHDIRCAYQSTIAHTSVIQIPPKSGCCGATRWSTNWNQTTVRTFDRFLNMDLVSMRFGKQKDWTVIW